MQPDPFETERRMDIAEFREAGLLQEVNRRFFHPLGLALMVRRDSDGTEWLSGIWDARDDPEGIRFTSDHDLARKAGSVDALWAAREAVRRAALGYMVQPAETEVA